MSDRPGLLVQIIQHKSAIALIVANLVPLFGLIFAGWNAFDMVFLYWLENVVIGFFNVSKMLTYGVLANPDFKTGEPGTTPLSWKERLLAMFAMCFLAVFFTFHYGIFTYVHGVFVMTFMQFGQAGASGPPDRFFGIVPYALEQVRGGLLIPFLSLFASHGFSFVYNFILRREYARVHPMAIMQAPYGRVLVMHFTVLLGGFVSMFLPAFMAGMLVLLKTGVDLKFHLKERETGAITVASLVRRKPSRRE